MKFSKKLFTIVPVILIIACMAGFFILLFQISKEIRKQDQKMLETSFTYTQCKTAKTWQMTDWNIECKDGYSYKRIEPPTSEEMKEAKAKEEKEIADGEDRYKQFLYAKEQWLKNNPSVKELFDTNRDMDTEYVREYLRKNPIAGSCALAWRQDVVCLGDQGDSIYFPTKRPE